MKYRKLVKEYRSLLFQLVEIRREQATPSGVIPVEEQWEEGLLLWPGQSAERFLRFYTLKDLVVLDEVGYIIYQPSTPNVPIDVPCMALTQEAFDYYDYSHSSVLRRWISDVWDKTEKHWLTLFFGWLGGWCAWLSYWLLQKLFSR